MNRLLPWPSVDETGATGVSPVPQKRVAFLQLLEVTWFVVLFSLCVGGSACGGKGATAPGLDPEKQSEAEYDVARDYFFKSQPRLALDHCRRAVELDDQNAKALYFASTIHLFFCSGKLDLHDPDCRLRDAESYVRRALNVDPTFREAKNTLGQILILETRYLDAIAVLQPLTKDPAFESSYLAWGNLGWAQVLAGQMDQGIESLKNSITEPRFCVGHYRLGVALRKKGDLGAAEQSLTNALSVDAPECRALQDAWEARAEVRAQLGKAAEAHADFEKCRDIAADTLTGQTCAAALARTP
jgi:type IV pilus assembly protein PilF